MSSRFISPFYDVGSGIKPPSGAKLFFFETDGTTLKNTFSDQLSTPTANTNPVIANSNGVFGDIFITGAYKVTLQDKNGSQIFGLATVNEFATVEDNAFVKNFLTVEGGSAETSAVENLTLQEGDSVNAAERTDGNGGGAMWDVVLASSVSPNGTNIVQCTGIPTLALVLREDVNPSFKFRLQPDQSRGDDFLEIRNVVDDIQVVSYPDGSNSGDAIVQSLPLDVRRDSHALIATAGTFGGSNDIDYRTNGFSDYILLRGNSLYQSESYQVLFDGNPSRDDGTKKNGTGGGGLTPSEDTYAFDAAMSIPSNSTVNPITFPALPVKFEKYVELARRSTGLVSFRFTPNVSDNTLTEETSGNTIAVLEDDGITVGGKKTYATSTTDIQASIGSHEMSGGISLSASTDTTYRLVASGSVCAGKLRVVFIGSGGGGFGVRDIAFQSDGSTITLQTIGVDNLPPEFTATLVLNSGILDLVLAYTTGLGGAGRIQFNVDWDVRTA